METFRRPDEHLAHEVGFPLQRTGNPPLYGALPLVLQPTDYNF